MRSRNHLDRKTGGTLIITQSDRHYAENNYQQYGAILGVNHQGSINTTDNEIPHLHRPVADEDTPTQEDIQSWVDFGVGNLSGGKNLLIHCQAGQNRSVIVSALIQSIFERRAFCSVTEEYHNEMLKEDPPSNWWPYEHWDKAIGEWLLKLVTMPPQLPIGPVPMNKISKEDAIALSGGSRPDFLGSLYTYAAKLPDNSLIVEIGTNQAQSTMAMACAIRGTNSRIVTIDPVFRTGEVWVRDAHRKSPGCYESNIKDVLNKITAAGLDGIISIVPDYSWEALKRWDGREISLLFIDGAHYPDDLRADLEWTRFIKHNGFLVVDDWFKEIKESCLAYLSDKPFKLLHESTDAPTEEFCVTIFQRLA